MIKLKYQNNARQCYMDTDSFIIHIQTEDVYKDIVDDVKKRFGTSNYATKRPPQKRKNKKVIGLMKDKLGGTIMTEFAGLRPKTYSCLIDDGRGDNEVKGTNRLKFECYQKCLQNNIVTLRSQHRFKSEAHNVFTEEVNKIALSSDDD